MKKYEHLPPVSFLEQINARLASLKTVIKLKKQHPLTAPAGSIRIVKGKSGPLYYLITKSGDTLGKYLRKNDFPVAQKIIQADYEKKVLPALEKEAALLEKLQDFYKERSSVALYEKLSAGRKSVVEPFTLSDSQFAAQWQSVVYSGKGFAPGSSEMYTSSGLRVRSKSEVIIAEALTRNGIPFRYEYPVTIRNGPDGYTDFHPDFYCLNLRTRTEFIWEHFGMMNAPDYVSQTVKKISLYEKNGWFPGKNAVFTFESAEDPLNARRVDKIISEYLE